MQLYAPHEPDAAAQASLAVVLADRMAPAFAALFAPKLPDQPRHYAADTGVDGFYHGPKAPGPGWTEAGVGPHGGKKWAPPKNQAQQQPTAAPKTAPKPAAVATGGATKDTVDAENAKLQASGNAHRLVLMKDGQVTLEQAPAATKAAHAASQKAQGTDAPEDHKKAAAAHQEAAGEHAEAAKAHEQAAGDKGADNGAGKGDTSPIAAEKGTPPPPGVVYNPPVEQVGKNGMTQAARVGVPAMSVPPPPPIGRLPNLDARSRQAEHEFITAFEQNPDKMTDDFLKLAIDSTKPGDPPTFETDAAKKLNHNWIHPDENTRLYNRATLNNALHGTANAICKRAFLKHLDTLKKGDQVLVTCGGCGAGKGFALDSVKEAQEIKAKSAAVWDSAGDQNATENQWIQPELEKRGLTGHYLFVHADPKKQWADPERGIVKRAENPKDGRMVCSDVAADSYVIGAKNHQAFFEANHQNPAAKFSFLKNGGKAFLPGIPPEAFQLDRKELLQFMDDTIVKGNAPERIKRGGLIGQSTWGREEGTAAA